MDQEVVEATYECVTRLNHLQYISEHTFNHTNIH